MAAFKCVSELWRRKQSGMMRFFHSVKENKLQIHWERAPFQNGIFQSAIAGDRSFFQSIATIPFHNQPAIVGIRSFFQGIATMSQPEASLGQDSSAFPDIDFR